MGNTIWVSEDMVAVYDTSGAISCYESFVKDISDQIMHDQEIIRTLQPSTREENLDFNGREFTLLTSKFPILDKAQNPTDIGTIATDITDGVVAETTLNNIKETMLCSERLTALGELTGTVTHELRNPLGAVASSVHVLQRKIPGQNPVIMKALDIAGRGITHCDNIITVLLDFARARNADPLKQPRSMVI